ncbi:MAG: alcohol dehydrogenase [Rhodospirillales bacterium]|nr:alcohol dehydrogenase [Rhodospirillales bacterium]
MTSMKAIVATALGGPEVLEQRSVPLPWPRGAKDVLVRLQAAALNPADGFFRQLGGYLKTDAPLVLGHDGAGTVEAVGAGVTQVKPGDRVCFCNGGIGGDYGTYAEFSVVPEAQLVKMPAGVEITEAAAMPLVAITLIEALQDRTGLKRGEYALIHAGAGGTGHIGIQIARILGGRVATTVSSEAKSRLAAELGAERTILYRKEDFAEAARAWTGGRGLDVALDNVGAETLQKTFRAMAPYGRIATLMGTPGDDADTTAYNMNLTLHNVMMLTPMWLRLAERLRRQAEHVAEAIGWLAQKRLRVVVDRVFPLNDAAEAHRYLESGKAVGKIVLAI